MAKILVIKAHPLTIEHSRTLKILDAFMTQYKVSNPEDTIETRDLYAEEFPDIDRSMMTAWGQLQNGVGFPDLTTQQQQQLSAYDSTTQQYIDADKVILANPMWNLSIPAKLQAWIDTICVAGKTFQYTETAEIPLVPGKKVLHIQTAGGFYDGKDFGAKYISGIMHFLGASDVQELAVEGMDHFPEKAEAFMQDGLERATALATKF
ncbi:MAG TPA: FMN-dependent NADH-azoreductase [Lactobacillus sp.]|nr:FMN-dependent NADH-azoreductase [Lactobacillus sp.]